MNGTWYYPAQQPGYDEVGIASWYGLKFHGRPTANGETYDLNVLTAALKTLPLPSRVLVNYLANGRSLVLTVNDRGPFVDGRIIDVTRRAAQLLEFRNAGIARVRVRLLGAAQPAPEQYARVGPFDELSGNASGISLDGTDRAYAEPAAQHSLENYRSSTTATWHNPENGHSGSFTPVHTFRTVAGIWCREFRRTFSDGHSTEQAHGTACRQSGGHWMMMF